MGGFGKISLMFLSKDIVFQCFLIIAATLGKAGLYVSTKIGRSFLTLITLFKASSLGMDIAFAIAALTTFWLFSLETCIVLSSVILCLSESSLLQILTSLSANKYGICNGWTGQRPLACLNCCPPFGIG